MIDVVCVRWSEKYDPMYVYKLKSMVGRNLTIPHKFKCVTPNPELFPEIKCQEPVEDWPGWWQIVSLFGRDKPFLFFGLDVVIADNIDCFVKDKGVWGVQQWRRPGHLNSTVMFIQNAQHVYKKFDRKILDDPAYKQHADQQWIEENVEVNWYPDGWCRSRQYDGLDAGGKVYAMHGYPKNHDILHSTVTENWY